MKAMETPPSNWRVASREYSKASGGNADFDD
jgi:hypothetical protein